METQVQIEVQTLPDEHTSLTKKKELKKDETNSRFVSDLETKNPISQVYFTYAWDLLKSGFKAQREGKTITAKNLLTIPWNMRADVLSQKFANHLQKRKQTHPNKTLDLGLAILSTLKWKYLLVIIIQVLFVFTRIFSAWVLKKLVDSYIIDDEKEDCWMWAGIMSACLVVGFHLEHHYNHLATLFPNHIQHALINLIFGKITRLSTASLTRLSSGNLINLCTNGVNLFEQLGFFATNAVVSVVALVAGGALIWQYFGVFTLIALGYILLWAPVQYIFVILSLKKRDETNAATARRIKLTSETLEAIRLLKMYAWEMSFKEKIEKLREVEVRMLRNASITNSAMRGLSFSTQVCSSFLMFMAYSVTGHTLNASEVFSAYFVIGYLRMYASYFFGLAINFLIDAKILMRSIEKVLDAPEMGEKTFDKPVDQKNSIEFDNFNAYWNADAKPGDHPTLQNVNLKLKKGSLNALVGAVGSGKTSFLMSFTGEMPKIEGSLRYTGEIAYVEQEPTIFAGTFRDNVTFGKPYEPEFYTKVVKACNLESDLRLFPQGDLSEIGERGNNLSGGQKARLALARAVYSKADVYLLDDPLSAVDPKVARSIFQHAIEGVLGDKTVLLTTHQVDFARSCENIIIMENGKVLGSGTYDQLKHQNIDVDKIFGNAQRKKHEEENIDQAKFIEKVAQDDKEDTDNQEGADDKQVKKDQFAVSVTWRTYYGLFKEMGTPWFFLLVFLINLTCEFSNMGYGRMLGAWIAHTFDEWKTLTILAFFVGYDIVVYLIKYQLLGLSLIKAARNYHIKMLNKIIRAKVLFFDTNPVGQILNRFSSDIGIMDKYIPLAVMDLLNIAFAIGSVVITVGIINPIILGPYAGMIIATVLIFMFCFPAVKQSKLYEIKSKGPLFGLLSATLSGIVIIRVYKQAAAFQQKFKDFLHSTLKANVAFTVTSRFMAFYVDLCYTITCIGCVFIITAKAQGGSLNDGGLAAFALALVLSITGILQHVLRQFSQLNISMSALARIQAYLEVPEEPPLDLTTDEPLLKENWPPAGEIDFEKVYMKYRPDGDHVLKELSLHVEPGKKIGCVGRTGAGKSTITQVLYRMQEIDNTIPEAKDGFIKIDDKNTKEVGLRLLRGSISIIPQSPIIFTGTIRMNVDPLGKSSDDEIWEVLEDVRLKSHVEKQAKKLDTMIHDGSSVFSAGQKQLVCLARAILKKSNILIMDEATANMDYDTDAFVQNKIAERFSHATQFTIAHRLQTIANYDKVLVLDRGRRVEFDEPYKLLVNEIGDTQLTNVEGHFSIMVQNTGPISSKKIFEIAREAYFERHKQ